MSTHKAKTAAPKVAPPAKAPKTKTRRTPAERLFKFSAIGSSADGCHIFTGSVRGSSGYGSFHYKGKSIDAHKAAWLIENGDDSIPEGMCVCHRCNTKLCVNTAHMYLGTRSENAMDAVKANVFGKRKLNAAIAREIFTKHFVEGLRQRQLAAEYNVNPQHIAHIIHRRVWAKATAELVHLTKKPGKSGINRISQNLNMQQEARA